MSYKENFVNFIIDESDSKDWNNTVHEWNIVTYDIDSSLSSECICGKTGIKHLFGIKNILNSNYIFPIGSECIKKFGREDLDIEINESIQYLELIDKVRKGEFITIKDFSRKLIDLLEEKEVFGDYNQYDFFKGMFNKQTKPTEKQESFIRGIIGYQILPFIYRELNMKEK